MMLFMSPKSSGHLFAYDVRSRPILYGSMWLLSCLLHILLLMLNSSYEDSSVGGFSCCKDIIGNLVETPHKHSIMLWSSNIRSLINGFSTFLIQCLFNRYDIVHKMLFLQCSEVLMYTGGSACDGCGGWFGLWQLWSHGYRSAPADTYQFTVYTQSHSSHSTFIHYWLYCLCLL